MPHEKILQPRAAVSEQQRGLPAHLLFFEPELLPRDADLLSLLRTERDYERVRAEYTRGARVDLRSPKAQEDFFRRIRAPQGLETFLTETQTKNHALLKIFQLAHIGQCISASLTARARGEGSKQSGARPLFQRLHEEYGKHVGRLSGHVGEAITGQLIKRSGWQARYPHPALDALCGFDRIAYHPATRSWRVIQCKAVNRLNVPFVVAGEKDFGQLPQALEGRFNGTAGDTLASWRGSLEDLASACTVLEKQYPGNTVMPMLVVTAGLGSRAYTDSTDLRTGLLRDDFRGSIDFENETAILPTRVSAHTQLQ